MDLVIAWWVFLSERNKSRRLLTIREAHVAKLCTMKLLTLRAILQSNHLRETNFDLKAKCDCFKKS